MRFLVLLVSCLVYFLITTDPLIAQDEIDGDQIKPVRLIIASVKPNNTNSGLVSYGLTRDDYRQIKRLAGDNRSIPIREVPHEFRVGEKTLDGYLVGTSPDFATGAGIIEQGRFLTNKDLKNLNNVAVLGDRAAFALFPGMDPIGKNVRVGKNYYLVVGVAKKGFGREQKEKGRKSLDSAIYIPISTMRSRMGDSFMRLDTATVEFEEFEISRIEVDVPVSEAKQLSAEIDRWLRGAHETKDYQIQLFQPDRRTP